MNRLLPEPAVPAATHRGGALVCFDIGRTNCRARAYPADTVVEPHANGSATSSVTSAETSGYDGRTLTVDSGGTLADVDGPLRVAEVVAQCLFSVPEPPATLCVAVAGGLEHTAAARELAARLVAAHAVPVLVTGDIVAAHAGCFDGAPGVVLAAGTGAVALGLDRSGRAHKVDGDGYLLGDGGSGYFVGREGLRAALRHRDGRAGGSAPLAAAAQERFGPLGALSGNLHARSDAARLVASFATQVAAEARCGDPVSRRIWRQAVDALAETAMTAGRACAGDGQRRDLAVALVGGLFDSTDLVTDPLRARLAGHFTTVRRADYDALEGAARIAGRTGAGARSVYEKLLTTSAPHPHDDDRQRHREAEEARR